MFARFTLYLLLVFFVSSCKKENATDCFKSNGVETTELRYPGTFTEIELNDKIELNVFYGAAFKVEVIAGKHIMKNISTKLTGNILKIENRNTCNVVRGYKRKVKINVTMPYVRRVQNNSVSKIEINEGFVQDTINIRAESSGDIHLSGTFGYIKSLSNSNGDIYISGQCNYLYAFTIGTNFLRAEDLVVREYAYIETVGIGDCHVNARQLKQLDYYIWSKGNIYYKGDPSLVTGVLDPAATGKIIKED